MESEKRMTESVEKDRLVGVVEGLDPMIAPLALAFKRTVSAIERETGIAGLKWFILKVLAEKDGTSQGEMSQRYEMDPSRVTRTAQAMEREGMVRRERDPEDNRVVRMYLTDEGRRLLLEKSPVVKEQIWRRASSALSQEEMRELRRMLGLLADAMKD